MSALVFAAATARSKVSQRSVNDARVAIRSVLKSKDKSAFKSAITDVLYDAAIRAGADEEIASDFASKRARQLSQQVTRETARALKEARTRLEASGLSEFQIAQRLRSIEGLNRNLASGVLTVGERMDAADARAREVLRTMKALGSQRFELRVRSIADYEARNAATFGRRASIAADVENGRLPAMKKKWRRNPASNSCKTCRELNGQRRQLDDSFVHTASGQKFVGPPAHLNCACDEEYVRA